MSPEETLTKLGYALPTPTRPVAAYVPTVRTGNLVYVAGQLPFVDGKLPKTGRLGEGVALEEGQTFARQCVLNALAALKVEIGELARVKRVVRVGAFVASADGFTDQPKVANGASELLVQVFGDAGRHARAAVGVNVLPLGAPVEVELLVEIG
ncbi:MAG TPA: RidA family protein [Candidatus Thermoplasmatota archaeon]|nr:RidA family protein [Candidatus Thermoplasmatota archaeon]